MKHAIDITADNRQLGESGAKLFKLGLGLAIVGALTSAGAGAVSGWDRLGWSYLISFAFTISLGLGALIWVLIQHTTKAGWSVAVRRLAEATAGIVPWYFLFALPIVFFWGHSLYHWMDEAAVNHDPILQRKSPYLNFQFFLIRFVFYFVIWTFLWRFFNGNSRAQDSSGDPAHTRRMERFGPVGVLLWSLSATFFAIDFLMTLDPHWFSTIFGVYFFAGSFFAFNALLCVICFHLQRSGKLSNAISLEHYHDIGKLMFAFTVFWSYIAFSQFMLIWYANLPEETGWFERRYNGGWGWVSTLLLFGHFIAPFLLLISRIPKRKPEVLVKIAYWNLAIHFVDIYWLVLPEYRPGGHGGESAAASHHSVPFALSDLTCLVMFAGVFVALLSKNLSSGSLIAERDPRLTESLSYENA